MRKKCVRWTKSVRITLVAAAAIISAIIASPVAQSNDPSTLPRLTFDNISYIGGFRLPNTVSNNDSFSFGGKQLAFNPASNSLFVGSREGRLAEVSIPSPVNSSNPDAMPFAAFLQDFYDPTEGRLSQIGTDGVRLDGLMVYNNRLYGTASIFYDANNTQRVSHYSHSLRLNETSFQGWSQVWETGKTGFVSGMMSELPIEWRALLGGPALTGQCCVPVATRTSWGPAAFSFDPARIGQAVVPANPLLYYSDAHPTLGTWNNSNPTYGATITMGGLVVIPNTRTALYFGTNGIGPHCYGNGTSDASLVGKKDALGELYCYDPTSNDHGSHAYPYRYQIWAYDLADFAAVNAGTKQPWDVVPYGVWPFDLPTPEASVRLGGVTYDPATQTLYLSQLCADRDGYAYRAVIHALKVNTAKPAPTPVTDVAITSDVAAPQRSGATIRFSAMPNGGASPREFKWLTFDGANWSARSDWTTTNEFAMTPTTANSSMKVGVWVRSNGNTKDAAEASSSMDFPIVSNRVSSVTLTANKAAPQPAGAPIVWTATSGGGDGANQYKWWLYDGASWIVMTDWSSSATLTWTPSSGNPDYRIAVWARSGSSAEVYEATTEVNFAISGDSSQPSSSRVTAVTLTPSKPSPQAASTTITWTATPAGGAAPHQYQWWLYDGASWVATTSWTTANTYAWTPTATNSNYRVAVWVRSAGSTGGQEASTEAYFSITAPVVAPIPAPAPPPPTAKATAVKITANLVAPQRINTTITWTAVPVGGVAPYQYQWWVFDGVNWVSQPWTSSNTFSWKPTAPNAMYRVAVWVRSAGNGGNLETSTEEYFAITQ